MTNLFSLLKGNRFCCPLIMIVLVCLDHVSLLVDTKELQALNPLHYSPVDENGGVASRVAQWLRAIRDSGFAPRLCLNRPRPGGPWGDTVGIALSGLVRDWPVGISSSHRAPATPVAGRAQCTLTKAARCTVFPPTQWCGWLPGWMRAVLEAVRVVLGCVSEDA
jgi:hypothetical protein